MHRRYWECRRSQLYAQRAIRTSPLQAARIRVSRQAQRAERYLANFRFRSKRPLASMPSDVSEGSAAAARRPEANVGHSPPKPPLIQNRKWVNACVAIYDSA
jgi:hypothetical protein